ncbi:hypothetical protein [Halobellus salinisoli]|uniref:hypothetical protein n=1 Tax=Halobellus salinisoli TaxID=3108500 RepID=UPI003007F799
MQRSDLAAAKPPRPEREQQEAFGVRFGGLIEIPDVVGVFSIENTSLGFGPPTAGTGGAS